MSNDAYKLSGLYSHHDPKKANQSFAKQKGVGENWKKKKVPSLDCASGSDHIPHHRKGTFTRNSSNSSSGSSFTNPRFIERSDSSAESFKSALSQPVDSTDTYNSSRNNFSNCSGSSNKSSNAIHCPETSERTILDDTSVTLLSNAEDTTCNQDVGVNQHQLECIVSSPQFIVEESVLRIHPSSDSAVLSHLPTSSNSVSDENSLECGLLNFRPLLIQKLANIQVFVLFLSLLVTVQQAIASGYLNSVITTLEKRYEVPSYITGFISSMYEIGNVSTVIFVSYLGSSRHIPVWIAIGCLVMGSGSLLFVGPQLFLERWSIDGNGNSSGPSSICTSATVHHQPIDQLPQLPDLGFPKLQGLGRSNSVSDKCFAEEAGPDLMMPVLLFMAGQLLLGAGGSPLLTLGLTYIDDHVPRQDSSLYIGIIYTMGAFGPVLGFLFGGYLLSFYVDTYFVPEEAITIDRTHPRWIGMWWAGFLIGSIILTFFSIPFLMFPKRLSKEREKIKLAEKKASEFTKGHKRSKSETSTCSKVSKTSLSSRRMYGRDVRDIPACLFKLLLNPIYFMTTLAACMELIIVSGFIVFLPKYLETQFSLSNVEASVFTGGVAIPGACVGTFLGGYVLKRFSLKPKGALQLVMFCNFIGVCLYGLFFVLGCENVKMAGATSPYFSRMGDRQLFPSKNASSTPPSVFSALTSATLPKFLTDEPNTMATVDQFSPSSDFYTSGKVLSNSSSLGSFSVNLTSWCNTGCECSHRLAEPVCGNNGLTYFSPCHAGCTAASLSSFSNCTCIDSSGSYVSNKGAASFAEVVAVPVATKGPCYIPCNTFMPFMVVLFLMCVSVAMSQMPLLMIVLRSVSEEERALALGLQFVLFRIIAYIPAPIMFGTVIDSTCLMWTSLCGGGRCLLYDIEQFRFRYVGICAAIKLIAAAIFLFDWLLIRWQYKLDMEGTLTVGDIVNSLRSVDRGDEDQEENFGAAHRSSFHQSQTVTPGHQPYQSTPVGVAFKPVFPPGSPFATNTTDKPGHKRSQSGCPSGSSHWIASGPRSDILGHKRSHSSSSPHGILANLPGHVRRPSAGYQVTFKDGQALKNLSSLNQLPVTSNDPLNHQYEALLSEHTEPVSPSHCYGDDSSLGGHEDLAMDPVEVSVEVQIASPFDGVANV